MTQQPESIPHKVQVPMTISYLLIFWLLTYLCYEAHELFHHLSGAVLCGGFGKMTFTLFDTKEPCPPAYWVTLAGPVLTFAFSWFGVYLLSQRKHMLFAYTLIFASFTHSRFLLPLIGGGDEWYLARNYLDQPSRYVLSTLLFFLGLPPLIFAFRSIANPRPSLLFFVSWLLPLPIYALLPMVDDWLFASNLNHTSPSFWGMPLILLVTNLFAILVFLWAYQLVFHQHSSNPSYEQIQTS